MPELWKQPGSRGHTKGASGHTQKLRMPVCIWCVLALCILLNSAFAELYRPPYPLIVERPDGLGAQLQHKLGCMLQASHGADFYYVHTPFRRVEHLKDEKHPHILENFFNLGHGEVRRRWGVVTVDTDILRWRRIIMAKSSDQSTPHVGRCINSRSRTKARALPGSIFEPFA